MYSSGPKLYVKLVCPDCYGFGLYLDLLWPYAYDGTCIMASLIRFCAGLQSIVWSKSRSHSIILNWPTCKLTLHLPCTVPNKYINWLLQPYLIDEMYWSFCWLWRLGLCNQRHHAQCSWQCWQCPMLSLLCCWLVMLWSSLVWKHFPAQNGLVVPGLGSLQAQKCQGFTSVERQSVSPAQPKSKCVLPVREIRSNLAKGEPGPECHGLQTGNHQGTI